MYSLHHERRQQAHELVKELKVGVKSGINISGVGKSFSWKRPANEIAFELYGLARLVQTTSITSLKRSQIPAVDLLPLAALRVGRPSLGVHCYDDKYLQQLRALELWGKSGAGSQLPTLSRNTAGQWATETGQLIRIVFGENFETHHRLRELKQSVLRSAKGGGPAVVRSRMLKAIKQAWRSIAPLE